MENLISSGCQAIISGYDTNIVAAMSTCADAGVYYVVALDHITEDDSQAQIPDSISWVVPSSSAEIWQLWVKSMQMLLQIPVLPT